MSSNEVDLLTVERGLVVAPAGCGKTQLIADALQRHTASKPVLVLTHTNAGVAALRWRLNRAGVKPSEYRLETIDGWAIRLVATFPARSGHDPSIIESLEPDYPMIREAASHLLGAGHINDVIVASYDRILVDEYQDCSTRQHEIVSNVSEVLPVCVLGDPLQAIFGFDKHDPLAGWDAHIRDHFTPVGELKQPHRWINAGMEPLGQWLLETRQRLLKGDAIALQDAPEAVTWVELRGHDDRRKQLAAATASRSGSSKCVLIIGESRNPRSQHRFASQIPGAVAVEAVNLTDLVRFARDLDPARGNAVEVVATFAQLLMTGVGAKNLLKRVEILMRGTARNEPSEVEETALELRRGGHYDQVAELLVSINKQRGSRIFRPTVFRACMEALRACKIEGGPTFYEAAIQVREQFRFRGRPLPRRAVGSTLLLKGLEADEAVILSADNLDAKNLYVALTRASRGLTICSREPVLTPEVTPQPCPS